MARIGFKQAKYNQIDTATSEYATLNGGKVPEFEKVIDEKFAPEYNSAELYANDGLAECDYSFKKGTLSLTVADDNDELCAKLLGNTVATNEVTSSVSDVAPEFAYGHIIPKLVSGVKSTRLNFSQELNLQRLQAITRQEAKVLNLAQPLLRVQFILLMLL